MKFPGVLLVCALALPAVADEGMWLFNQFPKSQVQEKYGVEVTDAFLDHLRLSSVRVGGGSGSFVSPHGLIFTNHHVASDCIGKVGSAQHDYIKDGFSAAGGADELKCPDMEANVLVSLEDVTKQIKDAAPDLTTPAPIAPAPITPTQIKPTQIKPTQIKPTQLKPTQLKAAETRLAGVLAKRNAAIADIEKTCVEKTGNNCAVVKFFSGERYDLYQYRRYTDLRLVFAPEFGIAFFGGDQDNFTYPRYDLDIAFLRAYENGSPAATPQYLKWSAEGVKDTDLVFVAGNPGTTSRLATGSQLAFYRDSQLPSQLGRLQTRIALLREYGAASEEHRRAAQRTLFGFSNSYKSSAGKLIGLKDQRLMARKIGFERKLRKAVENDPKLGVEPAKVWDEISLAYKTWAPSEKSYELLERPAALGSSLFRIARQIVRLNQERSKPAGERLTEYRDSARKSLELALYSPAPIDDGLEAVLLAQYFEELKALGEKEAPMKAILQGRTPQQAAEAIVHDTKLKDVAERKRLAADPDATAKSGDAMIKVALLLDAPARKIRKKFEDSIESLESSRVEKIVQYRFQVMGATDYPDATFTPRVAFGVVKAYRDKTEAPAPYATTFGGMYHRAGKEEPYILPQRWVDAKVDAKPSLNLIAPFNFVSTCDITGGNSGSPTVNAKGEIVGIVFDGNIESLPLTYLFSEEQARAVHVASQGIVEALGKVYHVPALLQELGAR